MDNLNSALQTWNDKLAEIWTLLTQDPATFKGGGIWQVMLGIHGALQAIGYGLLVLFFAVGVVKTCGSFVEVKRPEQAFKLFIRFVLAKAAVEYGLDLMLAVLSVVQGIVSTIITQSGVSGAGGTTLPQDIIDKINQVGFWDSIPLWAVTLIGGLFITVLSFLMICGRAHQQRWEKLPSQLCGGMFGRCRHRTGLHHLFRDGGRPACC